MRARQLLFLLGGTSALFVALAAGCGGSGSTTASDSGSDVTTFDAMAEAAGMDSGGQEASAPEASMDASAEADALPLICQIDADLSNLQLPDASIGDSGMSVSGCYSCIETNCGSQVTACAADCTCKVTIVTFVTCLAGGKAAQNCIPTSLLSDPSAAGLFECLLAGSGATCQATCGVTGGL